MRYMRSFVVRRLRLSRIMPRQITSKWAAYSHLLTVRNIVLFTTLFILACIFLLRVSHDSWTATPNIQRLLQPASSKETEDNTNLLIVAGWRTGSSFLGRLFALSPETFYWVEPLHYFGIYVARSGYRAREARDALEGMFNCYMNDEIREHLNGWNAQMRISYNLWYDHCVFLPEEERVPTCSQADFFHEKCSTYRNRVMKIVRLSLNMVDELMDDPKLNLKVLHLVRDPRATYKSRTEMGFCTGSEDCGDPKKLCMDMKQNHEASLRLEAKYPGRFKYEDMASDPLEAFKELSHQYLGTKELSSLVEDYIKSHTNGTTGGNFSLFRKSTERITAWKSQMGANTVQELQGHCRDAIAKWGYKLCDVSSNETLAKCEPVNWNWVWDY